MTLPPLPAAWQDSLTPVTHSAAWRQLQQQLLQDLAAGQAIYPAAEHWYAALAHTSPAAVRVVILGQDPYHGPGQAHGYSFSVPAGVRIPPSLANIFKEIARDLGHTSPQMGDLRGWAEQGVLLLNSMLTVAAGQAGSHRKYGWQALTDAVVASLSRGQEGIVFMLWGAPAQEKARLIDPQRHLVLTSPHPSPLSAYRGFIGNGHFSAANEYLTRRGAPAIDWSRTAI